MATFSLAQLQATFLKICKDGTGYETRGIALPEADGLHLLCPKCFEKNSGSIGTHWIICWFRGKVPEFLNPRPGRWTPHGTGLHDLSFVPGEPPMAVSVLLTSGCGWHGYITNGRAG